jgi:hypothetical protein
MPETSSSRLLIPITHKTYKNKINANSNKTNLWEKITESFQLDSEKKTQNSIDNFMLFGSSQIGSNP